MIYPPFIWKARICLVHLLVLVENLSSRLITCLDLNTDRNQIHCSDLSLFLSLSLCCICVYTHGCCLYAYSSIIVILFLHSFSRSLSYRLGFLLRLLFLALSFY